MPKDARIEEARRLAREANETAIKYIEAGQKLESKPVRDVVSDLSKAIERLVDYLEQT